MPGFVWRLLVITTFGWVLAAAPGYGQESDLFATCAVCHGDRAQGRAALQAPALTALDSIYLKRQLQGFLNGKRGTHSKDNYGAQMRAAVSQLKDEAALEQLVTYIDGLPAVTPKTTVEGDLKRGKDYYTMICGSCHGPEAEGNRQLRAPALAGTDDWYLLRQIEHFRTGIRGGGDPLGQQMQSMAKTLPNAAVARDVVAYIQSLAVLP